MGERGHVWREAMSAQAVSTEVTQRAQLRQCVGARLCMRAREALVCVRPLHLSPKLGPDPRPRNALCYRGAMVMQPHGDLRGGDGV